MELAAKRPDRRVLKTKRAIREAFTKLACEKELSSITVKELADTAAINRKTFYNYYSDIYQIIEEMEDEMVSALDRILAEVDLLRALRNPYPIFARLTALFSENLDFYTRVFKRDTNTNLSAKMTDRLRQKLKEACAAHAPDEQGLLDLAIDYSLAGIIEVYKKWLRSDRSVPLETISDRISRLTFAGLGELIQANLQT